MNPPGPRTTVSSCMGATLLLGLVLLPEAQARVTYPQDIPNGVSYDCDTCHTDVPALNWFGADVLLSYDETQKVIWQNFYDLDSDRDGQTNGVELGDPCGEWVRGDTPYSEDVSNPADAESTLDSPDIPDCPDPILDDTGEPGDTGGESLVESCMYSTAGSGAPRSGPWWLPAALTVLVLRRRRRHPRPGRCSSRCARAWPSPPAVGRPTGPREMPAPPFPTPRTTRGNTPRTR